MNAERRAMKLVRADMDRWYNRMARLPDGRIEELTRQDRALGST